jgi:hypothetical protein
MHVTKLEIQRFKVHSVLQNMIILDDPSATMFLYSKGDEIPTMPGFFAIVLKARQQHSGEEKCHPPRDLVTQQPAH